MFSLYKPIDEHVLCKTLIPWVGSFLAPVYNLNKLGRSPLGHAAYQISRLYALWFQTRRFSSCFAYDMLMSNMRPPGFGKF